MFDTAPRPANDAAPTVGTPVLDMYGNEGVISRIQAPRDRVFTIGAGGLTPVRHDVEVCFEHRLTVVGDSIVAPWIVNAARANLAPVPVDQIETRRAAAESAMARARESAADAANKAAERRAAFLAEARERVPADAKAVIVAELIEDRSDTMTDYHGSTTVRTVILGFSTHTRDLFPELRKAARNFAETAALADAPESAEHREKYSMGAGYYLKNGWRDSNGWKVSKQRLWQGADSVPVGEWALTPPPAPESSEQSAPRTTGGGFTIEKHHHTKGGFDMWICIQAERVERAEYDRLLGEAKALGGWYSRPWQGTPGGFAFKSEAAALQFAGSPDATPDSSVQSAPVKPAPVKPAPVKPAPVKPASPGLSAKFRDLANGMDSAIADKFRDRLTNTPKRQREAQSQRLDGYRLQRTQAALRALAAAHDAGTVPAELRGVTSKAAVFELCRGEIVNGGGYYDAGRETGKPAKHTPETRALWAMLESRSDADRAADALREKIEGLRFANIPGYFPTPREIVARMIEAADIPAGGCSILEPSAGSGAILDALREASPASRLVAFERHCTLREILKAKGHTLAGSDFEESDSSLRVARVLMNPPFEGGQDITHVRRAFDHLEPGGRLVAIMSPGPFYRQDRKAADFREWFEALGGERVDLPAGAFKESGTGVATVLVTLNREA